MPRSKGKPKTLNIEYQKGLARMLRWNYCQKIAQLIFKGTYHDKEVKAKYHRQLAIFNEQTK